MGPFAEFLYQRPGVLIRERRGLFSSRIRSRYDVAFLGQLSWIDLCHRAFHPSELPDILMHTSQAWNWSLDERLATFLRELATTM